MSELIVRFSLELITICALLTFGAQVVLPGVASGLTVIRDGQLPSYLIIGAAGIAGWYVAGTTGALAGSLAGGYLIWFCSMPAFRMIGITGMVCVVCVLLT